MLRHKTELALYDIRPGNGAGLFWQPRSPHGADDGGGRWHFHVTISTKERPITGPI